MAKLSELKFHWHQPSLISIRMLQCELVKAARKNPKTDKSVKRDIEIDVHRLKHIKGLTVTQTTA